MFGLLAFALVLGLAFLAAFDGRDGIGRSGLFFLSLHRRRSDDGGNGEVLFGVGRSDAVRQLDRADVNRIADLEPVVLELPVGDEPLPRMVRSPEEAAVAVAPTVRAFPKSAQVGKRK